MSDRRPKKCLPPPSVAELEALTDLYVQLACFELGCAALEADLADKEGVGAELRCAEFGLELEAAKLGDFARGRAKSRVAARVAAEAVARLRAEAAKLGRLRAALGELGKDCDPGELARLADPRLRGEPDDLARLAAPGLASLARDRLRGELAARTSLRAALGRLRAALGELRGETRRGRAALTDHFTELAALTRICAEIARIRAVHGEGGTIDEERVRAALAADSHTRRAK